MKRRALIAALAAAWLSSHVLIPQDKAEAQTMGHILLLVHASSGSYTISGRRELPGPLPRKKRSPVHQGWSFQALDAEGEVIHVGELPNPHVLRGDFHDEGSSTMTGVALTSGADVTFPIRVPAGTATVVLYGTPVPVLSSAGAAARTAAPSSAIVARIDL